VSAEATVFPPRVRTLWRSLYALARRARAFLGVTPPGLAFLGGAVCLVGVAVARRSPAVSR